MCFTGCGRMNKNPILSMFGLNTLFKMIFNFSLLYFLHAWADALWSVTFILMRCHSSHKGHGSKSFTRWHCLFTHWLMTDVIFALSEWKIELGEVRRAVSLQQWNSFESLKNALTLYKCVNLEHTIVDKLVHHLILDHSAIIAAQILFNSGTQRQTTVTTTASFTIIYCSAFCVCLSMWFSLCQPCVPHKYIHYSHVQKASELQYCFK